MCEINEKKCLAKRDNPLLSTSTACDAKESLFVKFKDDYVWQAINHYITCNRRPTKVGG